MERFAAIVLAAALVFGVFSFSAYAAAEEAGVKDVAPGSDPIPETRIAILSQTLGTPLGLHGFDEGWDDDPHAILEIAIQFRTPPETALQLLSEVYNIRLCSFTIQTYEEQSLAAHDAFWEQVAPLIDTAQTEVLREHHRLFNGIYMRAPAHVLEQIAALPQVYGLFPVVEDEPLSYASEFLAFSYDSDPLMRATRELFHTDYIHNTMGITGAGVRVAVISGGVDATHPRLAPFANPETGWMRGFNLSANTPDTSPAPHYSHGTQTVGPIVAIAPGVELWVYIARSASDIIAAIEMALQDGIDVLNLSRGSGGSFGLDPTTYALNLAVLSGMIVVQSAGNSGARGHFSIDGRGDAGLTILVGNSETGRDDGPSRDRIFPTSSRGPSPQSFLIRPDIVAPGAGVRTTNNPLDPTGPLYAYLTGTSFSAPVITAVAALLVEAFPDAAPQEIKAKMMNTAGSLTEGTHSVFDVGAGHVDPIRALQACTIVTVRHAIAWSYTDQTHTSVETMASLSFGRADDSLSGATDENTLTMPLQIKNAGDTLRSYAIAYEFTRNPGDFAALHFSDDTISVYPGETGTVFVAMSLSGFYGDPSFDAHTYEGHIYVRGGDAVVARLPFAGDLFRGTQGEQIIEITGPARFSRGGRMQVFSAQTTNIPPGRAFELAVLSGQADLSLEPVVTTESGIVRLGIWAYGSDPLEEVFVAIHVDDAVSDPFSIMVGRMGPVHNHRELEAAIARASADGTPLTIEVGADFRMEHQISINPGRNITLTSVQGEPRRTITAPEDGRHFLSSGTITLKDIVLDGGAGDTYRGGIDKSWGGELRMQAGSVIQNAQAFNGGGVIIRSPATFIMEDGKITNNTATNAGGGVFLLGPSAIFTATGGTISNNHAATYGGGIWTPLYDNAAIVSEEAYANINLSPAFHFSNNTAGNGAYTPPGNRLPHIRPARTSIATYPLNNYDINYRGPYRYVPAADAGGWFPFVILIPFVLLGGMIIKRLFSPAIHRKPES